VPFSEREKYSRRILAVLYATMTLSGTISQVAFCGGHDHVRTSTSLCLPVLPADGCQSCRVVGSRLWTVAVSKEMEHAVGTFI